MRKIALICSIIVSMTILAGCGSENVANVENEIVKPQVVDNDVEIAASEDIVNDIEDQEVAVKESENSNKDENKEVVKVSSKIDTVKKEDISKKKKDNIIVLEKETVTNTQKEIEKKPINTEKVNKEEMSKVEPSKNQEEIEKSKIEESKNEEKKEEKKEVGFTLYYYDAEIDKTCTEFVKTEMVNANLILNKLKEKGMLRQSVTINNVDQKGKVAIIDFNSDFVNPNLGGGVESSVLDAVAKSFINGLNLDKLKITVDGNCYESGHIILGQDEYFTK